MYKIRRLDETFFIRISLLKFKINVSIRRLIIVLHTEINNIIIRFRIAEI